MGHRDVSCARRSTFVGGVWLLGLLVVVGGWMPAAAQPFAYVTQPASVAVINTAISSVVATIPVASPHAIAVTPDGAFAYVTQVSTNTVAVLELATGRLIATIPVADGVNEIAITPDGALVYATSGFGINTVAVINTATNTVVATIRVGNWPQGVVISPDGSHVYVVNFGSEDVSVVATASQTVVARVGVGRDPVGIAITPDGAFTYVPSGGGLVWVIATPTNTLAASVFVGGNPFWAFVTPDGALAYVDSGAVLETATQTVIARRDLPSARAAFTPDGTRGYVLAVAGVAVIDPKTLTVLSTIPREGGGGGIAIPTLPPRFGAQCPLGPGFWRTRADAWPLTALTLGSQTYSQAELLALLNMPARGDASVILANQLLAAKLSIAHGATPSPIGATILEADSLLSRGFSGKLPYRMAPSSPTGQQMVDDATVLESYNNGDLTATCQPALVSAR
jgi:YVTN family beta-propeller protein